MKKNKLMPARTFLFVLFGIGLLIGCSKNSGGGDSVKSRKSDAVGTYVSIKEYPLLELTVKSVLVLNSDTASCNWYKNNKLDFGGTAPSYSFDGTTLRLEGVDQTFTAIGKDFQMVDENGDVSIYQKQ